jgi:hypothetical protein
MLIVRIPLMARYTQNNIATVRIGTDSGDTDYGWGIGTDSGDTDGWSVDMLYCHKVVCYTVGLNAFYFVIFILHFP